MAELVLFNSIITNHGDAKITTYITIQFGTHHCEEARVITMPDQVLLIPTNCTISTGCQIVVIGGLMDVVNDVRGQR